MCSIGILSRKKRLFSTIPKDTPKGPMLPAGIEQRTFVLKNLHQSTQTLTLRLYSALLQDIPNWQGEQALIREASQGYRGLHRGSGI